jgi:hypothetical protein
MLLVYYSSASSSQPPKPLAITQIAYTVAVLSELIQQLKHSASKTYERWKNRGRIPI